MGDEVLKNQNDKEHFFVQFYSIYELKLQLVSLVTIEEFSFPFRNRKTQTTKSLLTK